MPDYNEKFFKTTYGVIKWMFHNYDATCGDAIMTNEIDDDLIDEALSLATLDGVIDKDIAFDVIQERCRQYGADIGTEAYEWEKELFDSEPFAVGCSIETLLKIKEALL